MRDMVSNMVSDYRVKKEVTQEELAHATGVTRQTVIALERGNYTPSVALALKIARYFNVSVEKLFSVK